MRIFSQRGLVVLAALLLSASIARAQHPSTQPAPVEKPWPRVGFVEVLDGRKYISTLGHTSVEDGDVLIYLTNAGDGSNRMFVAERLGRIWIMQDGKLLPQPFLDITTLTDIRGEHGLLCLAFPPGSKSKDHFYVSYTNRDGNPTIARYRIDPKNPNRALPDSGEVLLTVPHPRYTNHQGGQIAFGKDGMLYWGIGDGGGQYDPNLKAQRLDALTGKILRLDVEGKPDAGKPYRVPPDNPFVKTPGASPEVWVLGVRNPWRFSFDPANGDLYAAIVGEQRWEAIYWIPGGDKGGENFGWSIYEGSHGIADGGTFGYSRGMDLSNEVNQKPGTSGGFTFPVAEFSHSAPAQLSSIIGGYVYHGAEYPDWQGVYFFSDWVTSRVWALRRDPDQHWQSREVDGGQSPIDETVSLGVDEKGNIYALSFVDGKIYRLIERPAGK